jgi:2-oxoglutarate decarboxylase
MATQTTIDVVMPQMGDSVTEGTILEWHVQEGATVAVDDILVEISTDKVDAEMPSPIAGVLVEILAKDGEDVQVGQVLARISTDGGGAAGTAPAGDSDGAATAPPAGGAGELLDIIAPSGGESVTEATVLDWIVEQGATVADGDPLLEVSTDKVDMELPAPGAGVLVECLVEAGETIVPGQILGRVQAGATAGSGAAPAAPATGAAAVSNGAATVPDDLKISPIAARKAHAEGISLAGIQGSGTAGRITVADLDQAGAGNGAVGTGAGDTKSTVLRGGAGMLAKYMDESLTVPTATSFRTVTVTQMAGRREQLKAAGKKVSFTHLIAYAIARAATEEMPVMAYRYEVVDGKSTRHDDGQVNLGIAVDVEKRDGSRTLMVPIIRDAGRLTFQGFLDAFNDLIAKARENKLSADDLQGGNISLTNPGGLGTIASVPRLMAGQGTIVATGSIDYPVGLQQIGKELGVEKVMTMTSTYDHRIIQGAESGRFLKVVEGFLQGDHEFYERLFADLGAAIGSKPQAPTLNIASAPAASVAPSGGIDVELLQAVQAGTAIIKAHRTHGHLAAKLDPLGTEPKGDPSLSPEAVNLTPSLMSRIPSSVLRVHVDGESLAESLPKLRDVYCGTLAYEVEHISSHRQRVWLREQIESGAHRQPLASDEKLRLLDRLVAVDAFERFMHKAYLGQKQFSIEGLDMTVPMIDELIWKAAHDGAQEVVIGMAHRGRLSVLAHNLERAYDSIFAEFEGASDISAVTTIPQGGTGDVKYHHGAAGSQTLSDGTQIRVHLESNPSHLEFVHPVVLGAARSVQTTRDQGRIGRDTRLALPIVLHGDAAFPGQGVVAESLNLQALDGYNVGGAVHLIQNNQVGFTTDPDDSRSTHWSSDLAKGFDVPIIHVNADDVEACIAAVRLAFAFRKEFGHDVVIDLIGYRRFGHNEADEPAYTQPMMYQRIKDHPRVSEIWAEKLVSQSVLHADEVVAKKNAIWQDITGLHQGLKERIKAAGGDVSQATGQTTGSYMIDTTPGETVHTAVAGEVLHAINEELLRIPDGFTVHPKLLKTVIDKRRKALGENGGIDWAHAESLAFASLLHDGVPVRLTGQDAERGTFSQRHAVLHDYKNGSTYSSIQSLPDAKATLELHNSPLSETACLGFEYGYAEDARESLVLWEAQFGDFGNGAQVIIDQFIVSGMAKWGQTSRLTLLLPHGYEGSGPEHSSARLERFLQLAAEGNIRVANLTTPAQYFHLLRAQALSDKLRPLVVMTPKSLLRLSAATNRIQHLSDTKFFSVLGEPRVDHDKVERLVLCTGKVYYDLVGHPTRQDNERVAVGRVELLYPFPEEQLRQLIESYPNLKEVVWVQEEPRNMGARAHMFPRLTQMLQDRDLRLGYIGRPERASPGEGYPAAHLTEQNRIVETALDMGIAVSPHPRRSPGRR